MTFDSQTATHAIAKVNLCAKFLGLSLICCCVRMRADHQGCFKVTYTHRRADPQIALTTMLKLTSYGVRNYEQISFIVCKINVPVFKLGKNNSLLQYARFLWSMGCYDMHVTRRRVGWVSCGWRRHRRVVDIQTTDGGHRHCAAEVLGEHWICFRVSVSSSRSMGHELRAYTGLSDICCPL